MAWKRDPKTGLPISVEVSEASLHAAADAGCNIVCVRSFAAAAGYGPYYFEAQVMTDTRSFFHAMPLREAGTGRIVGWATHINSARAGGDKAREAAKQKHLETITDTEARNHET